MGSCINGNGNTYIAKRKPSNKNSKTVGCFSSLCKGQDNIDKDNKISSEIVTNPKIKSSFNFYHKNDKLNIELNSLINKYKDDLKIQKINFEQIFNIFMNFTYDFTKSNFIICDTRELSVERSQLFLKKFPQINYNIKQLEQMKKERVMKFFAFLKGKNLIFILKDESSLVILEKFVIFFTTNEGKLSLQNLFILSQYICNNEANKQNIYEDFLYFFIDEDLLYAYSPKILINSNDIKSSSLNNSTSILNYGYIFFNYFPHIKINEFNNYHKIITDKTKMLNKFDINYLKDKKTLNTDIFLNFISKFKIVYIMNFISCNELNNIIIKKNSSFINYNDGKRNKINKEDKHNLIKQKNIIVPKNIEFDEYYKEIHNEIIPIIEELKQQMILNNCILIQFDNDIDKLFLLKLIYIIVFRITGLTFDDIYNYLQWNFFEIGNESFMKIKKNEILNFLV